MTLKHYYDGGLISNVVPLDAERGFSSRASIGNPDTIRVRVDDPTGVLDFVGYKTWSMEEDACPPGSRVVWRGYVGKQVIGRGGDDLVTGAGRRWDLDLIEGNGWLSRRALRSPSANRPAETVSRRIAWLLTQPGFTGFIVDHGNVEACTTKLDPTDYRTRRGSDVLRDCSEASGFNHWIRWREASSDWELFFLDPNASELDTSPLRISNVAADVDLATTWPPSMDAKLERNPNRIGSGFLVPYGSAGAFVYDRSAATAAEFGEIDQTWPSANVKTRSAALALADRALDQHDEQDERLTSVRLHLPAANLNDVRAGQRIAARFSHLPGYTTPQSCRVVSKAFSRPESRTQAFYDVDLELSLAGASIIQQLSYATTGAGGQTVTFTNPIAAGSLLILLVSRRNGGTSAIATAMAQINRDNAVGPNRPFTNIGAPTYGLVRAGDVAGADACGIGYRIATGDEQTLYFASMNLLFTLYEVSGVAVSGAEVQARSSQSSSVAKNMDPWTTTGALQFAVYVWDTGDPGTSPTQTPGLGWTEDFEAKTGSGHPGIADLHSMSGAAPSISGTAYEWGGVAVALQRP